MLLNLATYFSLKGIAFCNLTTLMEVSKYSNFALDKNKS